MAPRSVFAAKNHCVAAGIEEIVRKYLLLLAAGFLAVLAGAPGHAQNAPPQAAGILILGDSNSEGPFGLTLYDTLRATRDPVNGLPLNVTIYAKCGAGANDWVVREYSNIDCGAWSCGSGKSLRECSHFNDGFIPPLSDLYAELQAGRRVTLVVLGLNMIIGNRAQKLRDAERLIAAIHEQHSACIWIGPPQTGTQFVAEARFESFVADLKRTVTRNACRYIASDDKTDRAAIAAREDHYPKEEAVLWAQKVLNELDHPANREDKALLVLLRSVAGINE